MNAGIAAVLKTMGGCILTLALGLSTAQAYVLDTWLDSEDLTKSGSSTELDAMERISGNSSLVLIDKFEGGELARALNLGTSDQFFIDLGGQHPLYFLLKFGTGKTGVDSHHFFQNVGELNRLVFSNRQIGELFGDDCGVNGKKCDTGSLSHVTFYAGTEVGGGDGGNTVPEPATIALVGLGLLGFAALRRKARIK